MWFKNLQVYSFKKDEDFNFDTNNLEDVLQNNKFAPCPKIMPYSTGWVAPIGESENSPLVHEILGFQFFSLQTEQKIIPAAVVRQEVSAKVKELEAKQGRRFSSKEKLAVKDDVYGNLLPRAFSKTTRINAYIDTMSELLIIDTPTKNKAEEFCSFLRKSLGSLPIYLPGNIAPMILLTRWLSSGRLPEGFSFGEKCLLSTIDENGSVKCDRQDILSENIRAFLREGAEVKQLQLIHRDKIRFTFKHDLSINGLKFSDFANDLIEDCNIQSKEQEQDTTYMIMVKLISELLKDLLPNFDNGLK